MTKQCCLLAALLVLVFSFPARAAEDAALGTGEYFLSPTDKEGHIACESDLGSFGADALRWFAGADAALLPAGDLGETLQAGEITPEAVAASFPEDEELIALTVTGEELYRLLEGSVSHVQLLETERVDWEASEFGGFLHLSGLRVTYDYSANPGTRVYRLTDETGEVIQADGQDTYLLATTRSVLEGAYGDAALNASDARTVGTLREAVEEYIRSQESFDRPSSGRIKVIGTKEYTIIRRMPAVFLVLLVALFAGFNGYRTYRRKMKYER